MTDVFFHHSKDPLITEAAEQARESFRIFWREVTWERNRIIPGLGIAAVKAPFCDPPTTAESSDNPEVENMWISEVDFDGETISGTLVNEPEWLKSIKVGDDVAFERSRLMDWMYAIGSDPFGGFTVNAMRRKMNNRERKAHDKAWGLDFGDPENVLLVPPSYIGDKDPRGGWLSKLFPGRSASQQSLDRVTEFDHPMAINCLEAFSAQMDDDQSVLEFVDDDGMTSLHRFSMGGAADIVDAMLSRGADPHVQAHNGLTALQMAESLGWTRTCQVLREYAA